MTPLETPLEVIWNENIQSMLVRRSNSVNPTSMTPVADTTLNNQDGTNVIM